MNNKHQFQYIAINEHTREFHSDLAETLSEWIHQNIETKITINMLSAVSGYSKWHLQRVFKSNMGVSIGHYIINCRLEKACKSLISETVTICEVSIRLGYESQQSFNRTFKRVMGMTPTAYRDQVSVEHLY
ncbi:helix-turn-helix domain-containing protein [Scandinavium goeteborgense]|uniref:helix-turn-helix domain-containing protein n=1 Tax=Scandinavium goeteborgense TaxID=1851514 RepID=UPI000F6800E5|nr:helix-turn-helix transcriptional regulator [Scandinavium goeteborgense]